MEKTAPALKLILYSAFWVQDVEGIPSGYCDAFLENKHLV